MDIHDGGCSLTLVAAPMGFTVSHSSCTVKILQQGPK
jgi:hypothetical protein